MGALWIAVNADNVPDLATLHVDEVGCLQMMDEIGLMGFEPRRCTLAIHKAETLSDGRDGSGSEQRERVDTDIVERVKRIRVYVQDCIETGHDRASLGNLMSARDETDFLLAEIERLRALPAPSEWRGIESAPKDGTAIIVAVYTNLYGWVLGHSRWDGARGIYGWVSGGFNDPPGTLGLAHPTHWQPLPAPPGKEKEGAG